MKLRFAWYDLWIGAYVDTAKRRLYICPLRCVLIEIQMGRRRSWDGEAYMADVVRELAAFYVGGGPPTGTD